MSDDKNPFSDFDFDNLQVGGQPPPLNTPPVAAEPLVERPKRGRKAKAPKAEKPKRTRGPRRQPTTVTTADPGHIPADPVPLKQTRKPRTPKTEHRAIRLDLATAMQVASTLKDGDGPLFQKMVHALGGLNKASRDRILAALGKVFA